MGKKREKNFQNLIKNVGDESEKMKKVKSIKA